MRSVIMSGFDSDATRFFSAAGVTAPTQKTATDKLVKGLKANGLWDKMVAVYPFVGGTATTHAQNLRSAAFPISWSGTVTHNANGITGDGSSGFGDTGITPLAVGALGGVSLYMRTAPTGDSNQPFGVVSGLLQYGLVFNVTGNQHYGIWSNTGSLAIVSAAPTPGMFSLNRTSTTALRLDKNGAQAATDATSSVDAAPSDENFYILARNNSAAADSFSEENDAFIAFHSALTLAESATLYSLVQTFQTSLGRQV